MSRLERKWNFPYLASCTPSAHHFYFDVVHRKELFVLGIRIFGKWEYLEKVNIEMFSSGWNVRQQPPCLYALVHLPRWQGRVVRDVLRSPSAVHHTHPLP